MSSVLRKRRYSLLSLLRQEIGQDLAEYALVVALISLGAIASMKTLAIQLNSAYISVNNTLTSYTS